MATGERIYIADKETLDKCYAILASDPIYGFIEHMDILSPSQRIEYIGLNAAYTPMTIGSDGAVNLGSWAGFEWLKANKPWMVRSDGTPDYQLNENDYTLKTDGSASDVANTSYDGGAFAWIKKIYKNEEMVGNDRIVKFSLTERPGYEPVGFIDPDNNVLEGVWLPMFYGSIVETKMRSLSGLQPDHSNATAAQNTAITAVGNRAKFLGGAVMNTLIDLMLMFAKTSDVPAVFGAGNRSGYDGSLSPTYGVKQNAVVGGGQFYATQDGKSLNKIFHSIVLGSYQQYMRDPYFLVVNGRYKVSKNYNYDLSGETYTDTGITIPGPDSGAWFYPHIYQTIPGFGALPVTPCNGSTSLGGCDGLYRPASQSTFTAVALRFGRCPNGTVTGPRCLALDYAAGHANWSIGSALLLLPPVGVAV